MSAWNAEIAHAPHMTCMHGVTVGRRVKSTCSMHTGQLARTAPVEGTLPATSSRAPIARKPEADAARREISCCILSSSFGYFATIALCVFFKMLYIGRASIKKRSA